MKEYVGNAKLRTTQFGQEVKISFSKDDLDKMYAKLNAKGWINLNMNKRKEESQYGHTHSIHIDDWQPQQQEQQPQGYVPPQPTGF